MPEIIPLSAAETAEFRAALAAASMAAFWENVERVEARTDRSRRSSGAGNKWNRSSPRRCARPPSRTPTAVCSRFARRRPMRPLTASPQIWLRRCRSSCRASMPRRIATRWARCDLVMEGDGADTVVDGKACPMEPGDMIITPGWTWHEHLHHGTKRMVWLDGLDVPLHVHLGNIRFEPGPKHDVPPQLPDAAFLAAGLVPQNVGHTRSFSPLFRYPWTTAKAALPATPQAKDGSRLLRLHQSTDWRAGDGFDRLLPFGPGAGTCHGHDTVLGERRRARRGRLRHQHHWRQEVCLGEEQHLHHPARQLDKPSADEPSTLFLMTDRDALARLGLLRDEVRP